MEIIAYLDEILKSFETRNKIAVHIDTIRATFYKNSLLAKAGYKTKIEALRSVANRYGLEWRKLSKDDVKFKQIKKRYEYNETLSLTNIYTLQDYKIYYANTTLADDRHKTQLEIYGLKQYHKSPPPKELISDLLKVASDISSVDLCFDSPIPLKPEKLKEFFTTTEYKGTYYVNNTGIAGIAKLCLYDKALKNGLPTPLYRLEATAKISDLRLKRSEAILPLNERLALQFYQVLSDFLPIIQAITSSDKSLA